MSNSASPGNPGASVFLWAMVIGLPLAAGVSHAQQAVKNPPVLEEIVVTGSQIKGAQISDALPISIVSAENIEAFGVNSGDELLGFLPENGVNSMNEAGTNAGGVNSARGDVGAYNLRGLGTGNTLVLLNGRRVVNNPAYQTEEVGGSFVPVNTANPNMLPIYGIDRMEVLKDGASPIYGADAVAGVINTVLKKDFEGFNVGLRYTDYENIPRNDETVYLEYGQYFNDRRTNVGIFASYYARDRVRAQDDPRWANSDFLYRIPADSPWAGDTAFRNDTINSIYGQYDFVSSVTGRGLSGIFTDSAGEFETYPDGDPRCQYSIGQGTCGAIDGQGTYRYNLNEQRDLYSDLKRSNVFVYVNHQFEGGTESFTELSYYKAETNALRDPSSPLGAVPLRIGAANYWNPFGPCGSPNRLPADVIPLVPCSGMELAIDNYRFTEQPRVVDNTGESWRVLQGFRWTRGDWDWESAVLFSRATQDDITHNRVSNTLMQEALLDPTSAAYNPFCGGCANNNIERALIDVYRYDETDLKLFDIKASRNDVFQLPAGPVGLLAGLEWRQEKFFDDRDPRLDGTITFTGWDGVTFPFISDVVQSSPSPDSSGSRQVTSLFTEVQIPVFRNLDVQLALRYEDLSDVGDTTVGKFAFGWRPFERLLIRGSWSQGFRAPNLVTVNEGLVTRSNTILDRACQYAEDNSGIDLACSNSTLRLAQGSQDLVPETSENYSAGLVLEPLDNLTFTLDFWGIEKQHTIGLFGEGNHTILDLLRRLEHGPDNCSALQANDAVVRDPNPNDDQIAAYTAAGICPGGFIRYIDDNYLNLDTRTIKGFDVGLYYEVRTRLGRFNFRYLGSFLQTYEQGIGGPAAELLAAQESGALPPDLVTQGFDDLISRDGNARARHSVSLAWRKGPVSATLSGFRIGDFYQEGLELVDGTRYVIPSMTTYNASMDYRFELANTRMRARLGVNNFTDARAPLADDYYGYFADAHRDLGRSFYLDLQASFGGD